MDLSSKVLGSQVAKQLQDRISRPVLSIGSDTFTRGDLSRLECFNFLAAATLNQAFKDLAVKHTRDLFMNYPPSVLALPRIGGIALAVVGAAFLVKGVGGDHPLEAWVEKHSEHGIRTFVTIKKQAAKEASAEKSARKARKQQRKDKAHRIRRERFIERQAPAPQETL